MKTVYKFKDMLNDLMDYFILGDPYLLLSYKKENHLPDDLLTEFTTKDTGDQVVEKGIIIPMVGVENYPYTIIFNLSNNTPELLKKGNQLQVRQDGYCLNVKNGQIYLFTIPYLNAFTAERIEALKTYKKATIPLANGWYSVSVLGGKTLQHTEYTDKDGQKTVYSEFEATFEFLITPIEAKPKYSADIAYSFAIKAVN